MSPATDLTATVAQKLRVTLKQGQERLDAMLRRLGAESLNNEDLDLEGSMVHDSDPEHGES
ncbi:hypothetical protein [Streptomyces katrae]|uniref:hypothetical protein n=1 Tax=Streptomyces katrae TaxID=68223 RepID=UPI0004C1F9AB|nr:hypothetical protein [Streptomyces katrae]